MTKRAIIVGLVMAVVVLIILFLVYSPEKTQAPTIYEDEKDLNNSQSESADTTADLDADLNTVSTELDSIDAELDTTGL